MAIQLNARLSSDEGNIEELLGLFSIDDVESVSGYAVRHPGLIPELLKARLAIDRHFGVGSRVRLEVFYDPEGEGDCMLYAYVKVSGAVEETLARLDRLDRDSDWWPEATPETGEPFIISVEHA